MTVPYILSLGNKEKISHVCTELKVKCGMDYFVCYMVFNNGQKFVLSNMYHLLKTYYLESLYLEDYSCNDNIIIGNNYYLCDEAESVSDKLKDELENRFLIHRGYYTIKRCPECIFIFGAIKNKPISDYEIFYKKTISNFNDFCAYFLDEFEGVIKNNHPMYRNAIILNDKYYRRKIITEKIESKNILTNREIEVLFWAANGKTSGETAIILGVAQSTVDDYRSSSIKKLNCTNMTQTVFESVKIGYLGAFNNIGGALDIPNIESSINYTKTNIHLINS